MNKGDFVQVKGLRRNRQKRRSKTQKQSKCRLTMSLPDICH